MNAPDAKRDPVEELAEEFARRLRRGERPSLSEYTTRHPELAAQIHDLFPALVVMEQFGSVADPASVPSRAPAPPRLGDFRIVREIGRGGMGVVYEAVQESLGRHVALKVLPARGPGPAGAGAARERFRREAKAAAMLHHSNIVPVFAVGEDDDTLYYAMQFIRGQGLDSVLAEVRRLRAADGPTEAGAGRTSGIARRLLSGQFNPKESATPRPDSARGAILDSAHFAESDRSFTASGSGDLAAQPEARYCREIARLGIQAAEALHYAHQQGVLHRDVKPSNLLLDTAGTLWVTDFGLAKSFDSDDLTGSGDLIGTLRYMAPERFKGTGDARSDVYSLAVTLYEVLALRPAFDDADRLRVIERIGREDPPRLRTVITDLPRDLETVILKAAARAPADRYVTAQDLADDLRRFLDGRPVRARRHGWSEQAWRWCRRNPVVAGLTAAVGLLLVAVAVVSTASAIRLGTALTAANDNLTRAVSAEVDADTNRWRGHLLDARANRLSRGPGQRFAALASLRQAIGMARARDMPAERFAEMRAEAIGALALPDLYVERWWPGLPTGTTQLAFAADLATYARVEADGVVSVRGAADDVERHRLPPIGGASRVVLCPDGRSLLQYQVAAPYRGRLWDLSGGVPAVRFEESDLGYYHGFRPDGGLLAVTHQGGAVSIYDPTTGTRIYRLAPDGFEKGIWVDLHPTAPLIAVSSYFHQDVLVRDLRTGRVVARLTPPWQGGGCANWHPSGRILCVCHGDGPEVRVHDFDPAGDPPLTYRRSFHADVGGGGWLTFNRTGDRAAVTGWHSSVILCDFDTGQPLMRVPPGRSELQFDNTGRRLAATARRRDGMVGVWSVGDGRECRALVHGRSPQPRPPAVSPDGRVVAANFAEGLILFDLATGRELATVPFRIAGVLGRIGSFQFEPTGALLTNSMDGCFRWPVREDPSAPDRVTLGPPQRLPFHPGIVSVSSSRDGRVVAQGMFNGYGMQDNAGGWILRPERRDEPVRVMAGASVEAASVNPNGRWVAFGGNDRSVRVFDTATCREVWARADGFRCLFTPDGRWLATDTDDNRLYAADSWSLGPQLGPGDLACISADSRLAVLATAAGSFRLVEIETGRELARFDDPDHYADRAAFTPDGTRLVALARDGLRVWDLRAIREGLADLGLDWDAPPLPAPRPTPATHISVIGAALIKPPD